MSPWIQQLLKVISGGANIVGEVSGGCLSVELAHQNMYTICDRILENQS